ncbi:CCR4-NOT transcription complex subunit 10-like isoform X2 [Dysidea avara]|uniref:CCR4-NOT transcription complex subunit 10-like isoform X2 n=1 Tax=Dysidea avara TaxID=196820 RepID=UPI00331887F0
MPQFIVKTNEPSPIFITCFLLFLDMITSLWIILQFRARLAMLQKNLKGCKKEIKSLSVIENAVTHVAFLKANYEYLRGNYCKSVKLLTSAPKTPLLTDVGQCLPSLYFNNLGCLHYHMGKYSLASYYFSKALYENDSALNDFHHWRKQHRQDVHWQYWG